MGFVEIPRNLTRLWVFMMEISLEKTTTLIQNLYLKFRL